MQKHFHGGQRCPGRWEREGEPGGLTPGDPGNGRATPRMAPKARGKGGEFCAIETKQALSTTLSQAGYGNVSSRAFPKIPLSQVGGHFGFVDVSKPNLFPGRVQSPGRVCRLMLWPPNLGTKLHNKLDQVEQTKLLIHTLHSVSYGPSLARNISGIPK